MHAKSQCQPNAKDKAVEVELHCQYWCLVTAAAHSDSVFWATKKIKKTAPLCSSRQLP